MAVQTSVKPLDQNEKKTSIWGNILGTVNDAANTAARNIMATPRKQLEQQVTANANKQNAVQPSSSVYQPVYGVPEVKAPTVSNNGSIYNGINQNTLGNIKNIVGSKSQYDNSRYILGTDDYETIANNAVQYYDALRAEGRSDIADYLTGADTETAVAYLNSLGIDTGDGTTDMSVMFGNLMNNNAPSVDISATWGDIQPILEYINGVSKPDPASQAANQAAVDNMNKLFDAIISGNSGTAADSDRLMNMLAQYTGEQTGRYEDLYNYIKNENFYDTDTAKAILDQYKALGFDAMDEATAEGASANSGNIDSYAAANALRQQLDFTNAGNAAVLDQYNSNIGNMLSTLQSLGVDVSGAYGQMGDLIGQDQDYLAQLLGAYNTGSQTALDAVNGSSQYNTDAVLDALGGLLGLYETGVTNDTSRYNTQLGVLGELLANRDAYQTEKDIALAQAQADLDSKFAEIAADERMSAAEIENERALEEAKLLYDYYNTDTEAFIEKYKSDNSYAADIYKTDSDYAADIYATSAGLQGDQYVADRNYEADKYAADKGAEADKYKVDAENTKSSSENNSYSFDDYYSAFVQLRPEIKAENTVLTDEQIDEMTWREIGKAFDWSETETKRYIEWYRSIVDDPENFIGPEEPVMPIE